MFDDDNSGTNFLSGDAQGTSIPTQDSFILRTPQPQNHEPVSSVVAHFICALKRWERTPEILI